MNIFEDLIEELKDDNLLEETVIETLKAENAREELADFKPHSSERNLYSRFEETDIGEGKKESGNEINEIHLEYQNDEIFELNEDNLTEFNLKNDVEISELPTIEPQIVRDLTNAVEFQNAETGPPNKQAIKKNLVNEKEYYRKRAIDEVSGLQMVEHVLSGVEREQMKIVPKTFDDLAVKKALHEFIKVSNDLHSPEHAHLEFQLMQETESWYSELSHRDKYISVAHLRRYCETTRPILSAQALISLARFYRNSPFSESVRSKFDLILTRLFSQDVGKEKRELLISRDEIIEQLKSLYADWSSISLYSDDEDDSDILITTLKFEDFVDEALNASSFDELVKNDFFNRLRVFKENTNENFFAPLVTGTAVVSNVIIGNRYIDLLEKERERTRLSDLEEKYGFLHDQAISDATSKTMQLVELLKGNADERTAAAAAEIVMVEAGRQPARSRSIQKEETPGSRFAVNKWLLGLTLLTLIATTGLYIWINYYNAPPIESASVKKVNLENSTLKEYVETARINSETFVAIVKPEWVSLSAEKKEELLKKILSIGNEKGFKKVHLLNKEGKTVGSAIGDNINIQN